ncbi:helix-turn-helix transcriptional regulator [Streptomyces coelicoflavus]|uniref:helix-turn-helix domain-containing protein n=1 Tax=Streptomyces coelicoflavus TaxID=285562 RepID=UPI00210EEB87|nr:helix-turn-helix transcriptional regulator [Streptomyces coelicoflavus]MCQ4201203.1 helix-turn-helix transcriptional regulator [Streptomyces coelicoflavus]
MVLRREPTARQMRLATELRRLRDVAGLSATEAAALLGTNRVQISHIESGLAGVSEERLRRLAAHYSCTDGDFVDALVVMATDRARGWWEEYRGFLPTSFLDLAELEHYSTYRSDLEFLFVPGLLQTEDYARAAFASRVPELPHEELDLRVRHRMQRKTVLDGPTPVPYEAVVHEAALRIRVGDRTTARAQLARVLEVSEADHVTVRVIPFDLDGFGGTWSPMMLAGGDVPKLDTAVRDAPHGTGFIDSDAQLGVLRTVFRTVRDVSLDRNRSRDFIQSVAKEL